MLKQTPKKRVLFVRRLTSVLLAFLGVFSLVFVNLQTHQMALAATSDTINFQARLQTSAGAIVPDGNYNVEFKLYSSTSGGSALWTEDYLDSASTGLQSINGYITTQLGSITPFPTTIDWSQQLYLTMNIGGTSTSVLGPSSVHSSGWDGEMDPRLPLTAVPYAFQAGQAAQATELSSTSGSNLSTLGFQGSSSGTQNFIIQDQGAAGTYDLLTNNSGIQLQSGTPGTAQTGNFNISGTGLAGTALQTPLLQSSSGSTLTITGNAASTWSTSSGQLTIAGAGGVSLDSSAPGQTIAIGNSAQTHTIAIGTGAAAQTISIGSSNGTSSLALQSGTGNLSITTQGTGTLGIGNNAVAQTIQIGNNTGATGVSISGGTNGIELNGGGPITIGDTSSTDAITIGQATGSNSISVGSNISGSNTQTITIGGSTTGSTNVAIGSTSGSSSIILKAGSGDISFAGSDATNYNVGTSTSTGTITLGQSTASNVIAVGNSLGSSNTQTVNIATSGTGTSADIVTIGSLNGGSATTVQGGTGNLTLSTNNSSASIIAKSGTNSSAAFQIQDSSSVALFNVDTSTGTITLGSVTSGNYVSFTASGGLVAYGTAQHVKTIMLVPNYAGAVFDSANDSSCTTANSGSMTTGYDYANRGNYYDWTSAQTSYQCEDVVVQVPIPTDFSSWASTDSVNLSNYTSSTSDTQMWLDMRDSTGAADSNFNFSTTNVTPSSASAWQTLSSGSATPAGTYTPGNYLTLRIRLSAQQGADIRLGTISLNYNSKF